MFVKCLLKKCLTDWPKPNRFIELDWPKPNRLLQRKSYKRHS